MDAPPRSERLPELDALRGIAAFLVLVHHAVQMVPAIPTPEDIPGAGWLRYTLLHLTPLRIVEFGRPAVLFFFVLSGFVLTRALLRTGSPGLLAFAAQRTVRLGLPVVASVLLSVGLYAAFFDAEVLAEMGDRSLYTWLVPPDWQDVVSNSLLMASNEDMRLNVVLWSLVHEWRLTLLLPLILLFRGRLALLLAFAIACAALGVIGGATEDRVLLGPQLHSTVPASLYFAPAIAAGGALAMAGRIVLTRDQRWAALVAMAALFCMASDIAVYGASILLILLAMEPGRFRAGLRLKPALWLGRMSFSLYLVHVPVLVATLHALHGVLPGWMVPAVGAVLALLAAPAMHALVEEPARRIGRRVERALARPAPAGSALGSGGAAAKAASAPAEARPRAMAGRPAPNPAGLGWEGEGGVGMHRRAPAAAARD